MIDQALPKTSVSTLADAPVALRVDGVSKTFGGTTALHDVSFDIGRGRIHALCGGNGSGKSTLIKILAGVYQADHGTIDVSGRSVDAASTSPVWAREHGLHFVHQAVGTFPGLTVAENFAVASSFGCGPMAPIRWGRLNRDVQDVLDRFGLDVDAHSMMSDISPARQTMVAVARALRDEDSEQHGVLVLDEPTASLPPHEVGVVLDAMRGYAERGLTVVFVTHRLGELLQVADDATFLRDGRHLETRAMAGLDERGLAERIAGHVPLPAVRQTGGHGPTRLEIRDLVAGPLRGITLTVGAGEIVGVSGLLGAGRSTLLQTIFGARQREAGTVLLDDEPFEAAEPLDAIRAGVAYVPEDRAGQAAFAELSVRVNLSAPRPRHYFRSGLYRHRREMRDAEAVIDRYGVVVSSSEAPLSSMSGGNQQKVSMARWFELEPRLLLLDEPTQGVDIGARSAIHDFVRSAADKGCGVIVVSSDAQELAELCQRVVGLSNGLIAGEVSGAELSATTCTELGFGLTRQEADAAVIEESAS